MRNGGAVVVARIGSLVDWGLAGRRRCVSICWHVCLRRGLRCLGAWWRRKRLVRRSWLDGRLGGEVEGLDEWGSGSSTL
jgi:hypothetical protein